VSAWKEFKFIQKCLLFLVVLLLSSTYCAVSGDVFLCVICGPGYLGGVRGAGLLRKAFDVDTGEAVVGNFLHFYIFGLLTNGGVKRVKI